MKSTRRTPNTLLQAHRAGNVPEIWPWMGQLVADDLEQVLKGLPRKGASARFGKRSARSGARPRNRRVEHVRCIDKHQTLVAALGACIINALSHLIAA